MATGPAWVSAAWARNGLEVGETWALICASCIASRMRSNKWHQAQALAEFLLHQLSVRQRWPSSRQSGTAAAEPEERSAHSEIPKDEKHDHNGTDKPNNSVHECIPTLR